MPTASLSPVSVVDTYDKEHNLSMINKSSPKTTCIELLVLGHVTDHRTPIYAAPVAPSFLESTPLQPTGYDPYCASPSYFRATAAAITTYRPCI